MAVRTTAKTTATAGPLLAVEDVKKAFGGLQAVAGCTFAVQSGSITGLIGPNGAGKSTMFHLIGGLLRPDSGAIRFRGERIDGLPPHQVARRGLIRTFQIPRELEAMTVLENVMLAAGNQAGERLWHTWLRAGRVQEQEEAIRQRAREILRFVDLEAREDEYAGNLSVGQKKLLELARALMAEPTLLLLDEPAAGVAPALVKRIGQLLSQLRQQGLTILLIEHNMDLVMNLCDWVVVMSNGVRLVEGNPATVRHHPEVIEAYLGG